MGEGREGRKDIGSQVSFFSLGKLGEHTAAEVSLGIELLRAWALKADAPVSEPWPSMTWADYLLNLSVLTCRMETLTILSS